MSEWERLSEELESLAIKLGVAKAQREKLVATLESDFGIEFDPNSVETHISKLTEDVQRLTDKKNKLVKTLRATLDSIQKKLAKIEQSK